VKPVFFILVAGWCRESKKGLWQVLHDIRKTGLDTQEKYMKVIHFDIGPIGKGQTGHADYDTGNGIAGRSWTLLRGGK
jgi:hypothetical protein